MNRVAAAALNGYKARMRGLLLPLLALAAACGAPGPHGGSDAASDDALLDLLRSPVDAAVAPDQGGARAPILFIHGIKGSAANFAAMIDRFAQAGWPSDHLVAHTFSDPDWGCNVDNASTIQGWVAELKAATGAATVDIVAHSMGTLSSRYYIQHLGGAADVGTYVTLGGMHHGLQSACSPDFPFKPCVWKELCASGAFIADLDAQPVPPAPHRWVSIYGTADTTVPNASSIVDGAENVAIPDATHVGLIEEQPGYDAVSTRL